ncbi:alpha/beta-hydrolase [Apiospora aurea]|uniref:Alpha/beta-hydrolase n=1 Tax=Apiospora aurea TaxID=335848 RepID=A0ABR1QNK7_9PEZI
MTSTEVKEFDPTIPKEEVERLWRKLRDTRLPGTPVVPDAGDDYGPPLDWVHQLFAKWRDGFDWDAAQRRICRWKHYTTTIEDLRVHFVHQPAKKQQHSAIPLLLVHGWPGSWYEFSRVIGPLSDPETDRDQAFHVVAASIPGFTWSAGPRRRDWTLQDTARVFDVLMRRLGYARYAVQGGDWGHWVVRELGANYQGSCKAAHTNMSRWGCWRGWGEKYYEIVDPKYHDLDDEGNRDFVEDVCTTLCLYFFTAPSIMTSALCYTNNVRHEDYAKFNARPENAIRAPFGVSSFRYDVAPVSQRAAATTGNCRWFREHDQGGHFAALEESSQLVQELRDCFTAIWPVE